MSVSSTWGQTFLKVDDGMSYYTHQMQCEYLYHLLNMQHYSMHALINVTNKVVIISAVC